MAQLDPQFFKPIVEGTLNTLKIQCKLDAKPGKPFFKGKGGGEIKVEIAGVIGLASPAFKGSVALLFPKTVFLAIMNNMLGEKYTEITDELQDGAAELLNIIFGHAKTVMNSKGAAIEMAIPSIMRGVGLRTHHVTNSPIIVLPFICEAGEFHVEISTEG